MSIEEARTIAVAARRPPASPATDLGARLGRSRSDIAHTVRLLDLPDEAIELIDAGELSKGHGKALLTEPDHHRRRLLARRAAERGWSVRALEAEIARGAGARPMRAALHPDHIAAAATLEETVSKALGIGVQARPHSRGYQLLLRRESPETASSNSST